MRLKHELVPKMKWNAMIWNFQWIIWRSTFRLNENQNWILTSKFIIRWHNSTNRFVPNILIWTDSSNFSSNLTVAAEWNTTDTLRHNRAWSLSDIPSWGSVISPQIGITFFNSFGFSLRIVSKSWNKKLNTKNKNHIIKTFICKWIRNALTGELRSSFRRTATSCPRFGLISR